MRKMVSTFGRVTIREDIINVRFQVCDCRPGRCGWTFSKVGNRDLFGVQNAMALSATRARKAPVGNRTVSGAPRYPDRASRKFGCSLVDLVRAVSADAAAPNGFSRDAA